MGQGGFDVVVVKKSGPVLSMNVKGWWLYVAMGILVLSLPLLLVGGWLMWKQHNLVLDLVEESRLLALRSERLEALVQEQENRDILASFDDRLDISDRKKGGKPAAAGQNAPPAMADAGDDGRPVIPLAEKEAKAALSGEPVSSDKISIRGIEQKTEGGDLVVGFELTNPRESGEPIMGYITVVARGLRQGKPWIESWPPMRLTALGRPQNYRRGTPFSVQRYRKVKARVAAVADKKFERLEFVVYSRQGDMIMVLSEPVSAPGAAGREGS